MDEYNFQSYILPSLAFTFLIWFIEKWLPKPTENKNPPPSPPKLPVLGNLHQLGKFPHLNLHHLAQKHGPLMLLHFGSTPVLIVSSAHAARDIMKTHDLTFSERPLYKLLKKIVYNGKDVGFAPYGEYWRQMRSIFVLQLLSNRRVQSFHSIKEEETALFVKRVRESSGAVNLSKMFSEFTNDGICRSAFGRKYSESDEGKRFLELMSDLSEVLGAVGVGEYVPWLSWVDRFSGLDEKGKKVAEGLDEFLEGVIEERLGNYNKGESFVDIMIGIYNDKSGDVSIDRDGIKALLLDVIGAGTETSSTALEWAMAELLRHPTIMEKLQKEVRGIVKDKQTIRNDDIEKMHYLKDVIKETLRYHPPLPLLLPRIARADVNIKGYDISAGTIVMTNAWAIGRDPSSWDEPEKFKPERFLGSLIDYKGIDFELIPFGAGRRGCPAITYTTATIEFLLANLVQKFDWKLPNGGEGKHLDMSDCRGIIVHRANPLLALATMAT